MFTIILEAGGGAAFLQGIFSHFGSYIVHFRIQHKKVIFLSQHSKEEIDFQNDCVKTYHEIL